MQVLHAEKWLLQVFSSKAAREGGVIRRQIADVDRIVGKVRFEREIRRRGFAVVENAGQYVIFCNREPLRRFC